jgi:FMN phosphatase YigB (HAD superfamily)
VAVTLFFDLDKTLCHPRTPFTPIFFASCAPLLDPSSPAAPKLLQAWNEALEAPGPSTTAGCLARALAVCEIPAPEQLVAACARSLVTDWSATQEIALGAPDTLELLARRHPLGIITNGPSDSQHAVINALHLGDTFRWRIVSGDTSVGVRKPAKGIFQHALALSGGQAKDTWYIGDSLVNDIAGAAGVGWRTCWISAPDERVTAGLPAPDARIARLDELPQVISR